MSRKRAVIAIGGNSLIKHCDKQSVKHVALNYGTPMQRPLHSVSVSEMERSLAEGHFPAGSMGPKIRAAVNFIRNGGSEAIITSPEYLHAALTQGAGTHIIKD